DRSIRFAHRTQDVPPAYGTPRRLRPRCLAASTPGWRKQHTARGCGRARPIHLHRQPIPPRGNRGARSFCRLQHWEGALSGIDLVVRRRVRGCRALLAGKNRGAATRGLHRQPRRRADVQDGQGAGVAAIDLKLRVRWIPGLNQLAAEHQDGMPLRTLMPAASAGWLPVNLALITGGENCARLLRSVWEGGLWNTSRGLFPCWTF